MKLEQDPRFRVLSAAWGKFLTSAEGRLLMEFVEMNAPSTNISKGVEFAATTGSYVQGYRDLITHLHRLAIYIEQPKEQPKDDKLLSDRIEGSPYNSPEPE